MTATQDIEAATARVIAIAREHAGQTPAEFDWNTAVRAARARGVHADEIGGPFSPLGNALYAIAREELGEAMDVDDVMTYADRLRETLRPALERYIRRCENRKYTGWSAWSDGPIRYADR